MALTAVVDRNPGRRGATLMRAIDAHPQRTRSDLCSSQRTRPTSPGRGRKLIVETDGHAAHRTEEAFEADRLRDRDTCVPAFEPSASRAKPW